ncbi:hypothetical protein HYT53_00930 [Candidatus Woesearchaeota archaeon]|nr:hypothetical protein [Candidatus Woesearchaeota archaeon]
MVEKKQVLYDLRTAYSGPFIVEDFYAEIDSWIRENGFEKEPKKKMEHVTKNGKKIELVVEAHRHLDDLHHSIIVLRALLDNVKEATIKKNGKKIMINRGDVFVNIDGWMQSHIHGSFYQVKPVYYFIRAVIDKFIYNFWSDKYDGTVVSEGNELFKRIRAFFQLQKYKYE